MALLEVLPDFVENTLRELRAQEPDAPALPIPSPDAPISASEPRLDGHSRRNGGGC